MSPPEHGEAPARDAQGLGGSPSLRGVPEPWGCGTETWAVGTGDLGVLLGLGMLLGFMWVKTDLCIGAPVFCLYTDFAFY